MAIRKRIKTKKKKSKKKIVKALVSSEDERSVLLIISKMPKSDREIGKRIHAVIKVIAPSLTPRLWYGMPAYARSGKIICFFQSANKFGTRYATFGFMHEANLDQGNMWPVSFAVKKLTSIEEKRIALLVKKALR